MCEYIGLDVSMKDTAVSIRRDGQRIWHGKCPSDPQFIAELIRNRAPDAKRVVFETGPARISKVDTFILKTPAFNLERPPRYDIKRNRSQLVR